MKSARYKRLVAAAKTRRQLDEFHMERSFGAKKFAKEKVRRKIARQSKRINRTA